MKYRILTNEEKEKLKVGDEVYIQTSWSMVKGKYPEILGADTHVNFWGGDTLQSQTRAADLYVEEIQAAID